MDYPKHIVQKVQLTKHSLRRFKNNPASAKLLRNYYLTRGVHIAVGGTGSTAGQMSFIKFSGRPALLAESFKHGPRLGDVASRAERRKPEQSQ